MKTITNIISSKNYALIMTLLAFMAPLTYAGTPNVSIATENSTSSTALYGGTSSVLFGSSALPEVKTMVLVPVFGTEEKVKKGNLLQIDTALDSFSLRSDAKVFKVYTSTTTTFFDGEGNEITMGDLNGDTPLYVFGFLRSDNEVIQATRIVVANKAKFWTLRHSL